MEELEAAWSRLMRSPRYRIAIDCHRVIAVAFASLFVGFVIGGSVGIPGRTFLVLLAVAVLLAAVGAVIAWTVVTLAVRFVSRQSTAAGGTRFTVAWVPILIGLYTRELLRPRRSQLPPR